MGLQGKIGMESKIIACATIANVQQKPENKFLRSDLRNHNILQGKCSILLIIGHPHPARQPKQSLHATKFCKQHETEFGNLSMSNEKIAGT